MPRLGGLRLPRLALGGLPRLVGLGTGRRLSWAGLGLFGWLTTRLRWLRLPRLWWLRILTRLIGLRLSVLCLPGLIGLHWAGLVLARL